MRCDCLDLPRRKISNSKMPKGGVVEAFVQLFPDMSNQSALGLYCLLAMSPTELPCPLEKDAVCDRNGVVGKPLVRAGVKLQSFQIFQKHLHRMCHTCCNCPTLLPLN